MKKFILCIAAAVFMFSAAASADDYTPTSTWPYLYKDFVEGEVLLHDGSRQEALLNLHLMRSTVHFIEGDMIKEINPFTVASARIGEDYYVYAGGGLKKILSSNENGYVVEGVEIDMATLNATGAAYGSSSNSVSTTALSSLEGIGGTNSSSNINHMELKNSKDKGKILPLIYKKYIFTKGRCIYATKKDVTEAAPDKAGLKAFFKTNKVKWNNPESLLQVVNYFAQ